jgi:hypothetical protein
MVKTQREGKTGMNRIAFGGRIPSGAFASFDFYHHRAHRDC